MKIPVTKRTTAKKETLQQVLLRAPWAVDEAVYDRMTQDANRIVSNGNGLKWLTKILGPASAETAIRTMAGESGIFKALMLPKYEVERMKSVGRRKRDTKVEARSGKRVDRAVVQPKADTKVRANSKRRPVVADLRKRKAVQNHR